MFGKLPMHDCLLPKIVVPIHDCLCLCLGDILLESRLIVIGLFSVNPNACARRVLQHLGNTCQELAPNASMSRNCPSLVTIASHMGSGFALQRRQLRGVLTSS
jgi:hypothetical protein